ncbi:unnamed protein product [Ophioblennius macclurei]
MAADGCVLRRTLNRTRLGPGSDQDGDRPDLPRTLSLICRDLLRVVELRRYTRDNGSSIYFPRSVSRGDDLYDITLTDGDCRLQVTLDPSLNRLVERFSLCPGRAICSATFCPSTSSQDPRSPGACRGRDSFLLTSVKLRLEADDEGDLGPVESWDALPWYGSPLPTGPVVPLRADRAVFLPLWNHIDPCGEEWTNNPPPERNPNQAGGNESERRQLTVSQLRDDFLSGRPSITRGTVQGRLIVRIINKCQLKYYGKVSSADRCPYKGLLEVCDSTGSVNVVFWNSVCVCWFCHLKPGDIISLRRYRVKKSYDDHDNIEISVNSRNPATLISLLPQSSVFPAHLPAQPTYNFCNSREIPRCPDDTLCDVIGLLTHSGRSERWESLEAWGSDFKEYRWLRLEDGASNEPIVVKLFSTSQPDVHQKLMPMSVVFCSHLKVVHRRPFCYLISTNYTQVNSTGHHSQTPYRKLPPVRRFLRWLKGVDEGELMGRSTVGGFFMYPPHPISMDAYSESRDKKDTMDRTALKQALRALRYRERKTFYVVAKISMVTIRSVGKEIGTWFWTDSNKSFNRHRMQMEASSTSRRASASSSSLASTANSPRASRRSTKTRPFPAADTSRSPLCTRRSDDQSSSAVLFDATMEFAFREDEAEEEEEVEDEEEEEEEVDPNNDFSLIGAAAQVDIPAALGQTLPMRYDRAREAQQAAAVAMGGRGVADWTGFQPANGEYMILGLKTLPDNSCFDVVFIPELSTSHYRNIWIPILANGGYSLTTPPPFPADLISTASILTNQKFLCILEACHLGGGCTELVLTRAFQYQRP